MKIADTSFKQINLLLLSGNHLKSTDVLTISWGIDVELVKIQNEAKCGDSLLEIMF